MKRIVTLVSVLALITGLSITGVAVSSTATAASDCRYEDSNYDGMGGPYNCLGTDCHGGWCCYICQV
jgi:hypothetical protein